MATTYHVRKVCEGDGEDPIHFVREEQEDTVNENVTCPTHEGSTMKDFVIEKIVTT
jgi:hypothetical protein